MTAPTSNSVPVQVAQPVSPTIAEDNGYVKRAVMAVVNAVRSIFAKISAFFSWLFSLEDRSTANIQTIAPAADLLISPAPLSRDQSRWEALRHCALKPEDYLMMLESSRFTGQERDDIYVKLTEAARSGTNKVGQWFNSWVRGDAREHKIAQGKQIAQADPYLLIDDLRSKV